MLKFLAFSLIFLAVSLIFIYSSSGNSDLQITEPSNKSKVNRSNKDSKVKVKSSSPEKINKTKAAPPLDKVLASKALIIIRAKFDGENQLVYLSRGANTADFTENKVSVEKILKNKTDIQILKIIDVYDY